jgi:lipid-A-disaccharide synthase
MRAAVATAERHSGSRSGIARIGILAGGGRLPLMIAESLAARGAGLHIVAIEGEADPEISRFPHTWVNWGQIGRMVATLHAEGADELVIAGAVTRPDLWRIRPDLGFFRSLPQLVGLLGGGDDSVLSRVVRFFEGKGLKVRGVHDVAPDLLAAAGHLGGPALGQEGHADAELGFAVRRALGVVDAGQAVVVAQGRVLAIEGAEGTDAMLERAARFNASGPSSVRSGVLAKGPKPRQELRVDMPAIGPRTIERAAAAGLAGVVVEAGSVLVLDRDETVRVAETAGCSVLGLEGCTDRTSALTSAAVGRVVSRRRPRRADAADIETGLATVQCLAPFAAGSGAVVVRHYILAIEAAEGPGAMLERAAALRQWGLRWRHAGVMVRRADDAGTEAGLLGALLSQAASQGLAGLAVTGPADALAPYEEAARLADDHGLFLVLCACEIEERKA